MQLKYLNFYKIIAKFATSIIGAFVPLLIFQATESFSLAFLFITGQLLFMLFLDTVLKKLYIKYPQIFLVLRVIPIVAYCLCILLLDYNLILACILIGVFVAFSNSFLMLPLEHIFNYSSGQNTTSSLGLTRLLDQCGFILAMILGGLFLDNLDTYILIIVAISSYLVAVIPLMIYYFKEKSNPTFNQEAVSNALMEYEKDVKKSVQQKQITKKMLRGYGFVYFVFCGLDALLNVFLLYLFSQGTGSFAAAGYMQAACWGCFGFGSMIVSKLDEKKDITKFASGASLIIAGIVCTLPFVYDIIPLTISLFAVLGFCYSCVSYFVYSRFLPRARVMGASAEAQYARMVGCHTGQIFPGLFCCFGIFMAIPAFFIIAAGTACYSFLMPINEENTRKDLIDYLQKDHSGIITDVDSLNKSPVRHPDHI